MTAVAGPGIFDTAWQGWRYAFAAFWRMPVALGIAMALMFALNIATLPLMPAPKSDPALFDSLLGAMVGIVQGLLLTPVAIAVHRFVLLGELSPNYAFAPSQPRFMRFFAFTVIYQFLVTVPASLMQISGAFGGWIAGVGGFVFFALFVAAIILSLRLLILFPAIAVDARGADWRNALLDSKGHALRILAVVVLVALPMLLVVVPLYFALAWPGGPGTAGGIALSAIQAVASVLSVAAFAAAASRLFAAISDRLNEAAGS